MDASDSDASSLDAGPHEGGAIVPGDAALPQLDPLLNLRALTTEQKGQLCDWVNTVLGGYGTVTQCGGGNSVKNLDNQALCIQYGLHYACDQVTVGELETCTIAQAPSGGCATPDAACHRLFCT